MRTRRAACRVLRLLFSGSGQSSNSALRRRVTVVTVTLLTLCVVLTAHAESDRVISGTVYDRASSMLLEGVTLTIEGTAWAVHTDAAGHFVLRAVPPGTWTLVVERYGFRSRRLDAVELRQGFEQTLHIALDPLPIVLRAQEVASRRPDRLAVRRFEVSQAQAAGQESIATVLAEIPGVRVYGSSETPGGVRISVGGETAERVAVLLDGIPLSGGADGAVDLAAIPLAAIHVIEVRPGGQSAAVGDAGVGGAVNLITTPDSPAPDGTTEVKIAAGQFAAYRATASQRMHVASGEGQLTLEGFRRGSRFSYPADDTNASRDGVHSKGERLFARLGGIPRGVEALGFVYRAENGVPGPLEQATPGATSSDRRVRCQGQWQWGKERAQHGAAALWYESTREHYRSPQIYKADSELREGYLGGRLDLGISGRMSDGQIAFESRHRRLEGIDNQRPDQSFGVRERIEYAVRGGFGHRGRLPLGSAQIRITSALDIEGGKRGIISPRADLSWSAGGGFELHGGWGRSFRRPGLTSLFWKSDAYAAGNPDLRPERASEWDVSGGWFRGGIVIETRYFERDVTDIIVWERDFTGKYKPQNLRAASISGREDRLAIEKSRGKTTAALDYTHVFTAAYDRSGEPNNDGHTLVFTPRHTHQFRLSGQVGRMSGRLLGRWVSARFTRRANTKSLPPYRAFDASIEVQCRRAAPNVTVGISGENLTNEYIELLERYPSPGQSWSVTATICF
jgi:outer membrane receptor protein involved in Fe transport